MDINHSFEVKYTGEQIPCVTYLPPLKTREISPRYNLKFQTRSGSIASSGDKVSDL